MNKEKNAPNQTGPDEKTLFLFIINRSAEQEHNERNRIMRALDGSSVNINPARINIHKLIKLADGPAVFVPMHWPKHVSSNRNRVQ